MYQLTNFVKAFFHRARVYWPSVSRWAPFGVAGVLIVLFILAGWGTVSTYRAGSAAKRFSQLSDAFAQARFAVAAEESLNRKYRLQPSPEVLVRHHEAAASLSAALERARALGDRADGALISNVQAAHKEYLLAIGQMFAAVDAGDLPRANEIDRTEVDPRFDDMENRVFAAAKAHHDAAVR